MMHTQIEKFHKLPHLNPKQLTKYYITLTIFGKRINFRFLTQANTWFFRCENLYAWYLRTKWNYYQRFKQQPF
jgi:hypothetical protein